MNPFIINGSKEYTKMVQLTFKSADEWRKWLKHNHDKEKEVWLIYFKKGTGIPTIEYNSSVEEALCYGWIDSIIRRIDDQKYMRKFTPRRETSSWSPSNYRRVEELFQKGKMAPPGIVKVEAAKRKGLWNATENPKIIFDFPKEFAIALNKNPDAKEEFENLSGPRQKEFLAWIITAKREETRNKRIKESITLLLNGERLGLK